MSSIIACTTGLLMFALCLTSSAFAAPQDAHQYDVWEGVEGDRVLYMALSPIRPQNEWDERVAGNLRARAEQGDMDAQYHLGRMYDEAERKKFLVLWNQAWLIFINNRDLSEVQEHLEPFQQENYHEAERWYLMAAEQGHVEAQYRLGLMYMLFHDDYRRIDGPNAIRFDAQDHSARWLLTAAEQNHRDAEFWIGISYWNGKSGADKNPKEAIRWLRLAAERGDHYAQSSLGSIYYDTYNDPVEATRWYLMAAYENDRARKALDRMYQEGDIASQDYVDVYTIFHLIRTAYPLKKPKQVEKIEALLSPEEISSARLGALRYLEAKAAQGNLPAQRKLGSLYEDGVDEDVYGVEIPQDYVKAYIWFSLAAENGGSRYSQDKVEYRLSPAQLSAAQTEIEAYRLASEIGQ